MKNSMIFIVVITTITVFFPLAYAEMVPDWVKNTAGWWANDAISEKEFVNAIEFLIKDGIVQVNASKSTENFQGVPDWIKNTAGWWANDVISEKEFVNAIEFLVNVGIINIEFNDKCINDFLKYFNDKQKITEVCNEHTSNIQKEIIPYEIEPKFNSHGLHGEEFSEKKLNDVYRIIMVGGSTMAGAETTTDTTIPSIMQKMFDAEKLDRKVEVINAGIGGGNSSSEGRMIDNKLLYYQPDLIIIMDGWNDLSADKPVVSSLEEWELTCSNVKNNNTDLIIALQPIAGFGNKSLTEQEKINSLTGEDHQKFQLLQAKSTYDYMMRELNDLTKDPSLSTYLRQDVDGNNVGCFKYTGGKDPDAEMYDLRGIFDDVSGPIYFDQGHMLHSGNFILAEKFFNLSMKKIDSSHITDYKFTEIISKYNSIPVISYLLNKIQIDEETFQKPLKNITDMDNDKGKYFELKNKLGIEGILVGKDLRNVDLNTIDLNGQDITGANLSGLDLRNVDFTNTIIRDVDFSYTNLEGKKFSEMDIRGADFSHANLKDADMTDAIFSKTIQHVGEHFAFGDSIIEMCKDSFGPYNKMKNMHCVGLIIENESIRTSFVNADLTNIKFGISEEMGFQALHFVDFTNANLSNANMNSVGIAGCDFTNAILDQVTVDNSVFLNTDFTKVQMEDFEFNDSWFQSVEFDDANIINGVFNSDVFIDVSFEDTNLQGTAILEVREIEDFLIVEEFDASTLIPIESLMNNYNCKNNLICSNN